MAGLPDQVFQKMYSIQAAAAEQMPQSFMCQHTHASQFAQDHAWQHPSGLLDCTRHWHYHWLQAHHLSELEKWDYTQVMLDCPWGLWVSNLYEIMHVKEHACFAKHDVAPISCFALAIYLMNLTCQKGIMHQALLTEQKTQCCMSATPLDSMILHA